MYIDRPRMKTSAADKMATDLFSNLVSPKIVLFRIVEIPSSTVAVHEHVISNSILIDWVKVSPTLISFQNVIEDGNNANKDRPPINAMRQKVHAENTFWPNAIYAHEDEN